MSFGMDPGRCDYKDQFGECYVQLHDREITIIIVFVISLVFSIVACVGICICAPGRKEAQQNTEWRPQDAVIGANTPIGNPSIGQPQSRGNNAYGQPPQQYQQYSVQQPQGQRPVQQPPAQFPVQQSQAQFPVQQRPPQSVQQPPDF